MHGCYSTGWITTWGEKMANTSSEQILKTLNEIVEYGDGTGSVNLYMAHGGSNFGYWAGTTRNIHYEPVVEYQDSMTFLPYKIISL